MPTLTKYINPIFGGGWATSFGPAAPGVAPDENGNVVLPFLSAAEDTLFEQDGAPRKWWGSLRLNSSAIGGSPTVMGLFDFWRMGTSGTATQKRVCHAGTTVYKDDADGTWDVLEAGHTAGAIPNYEVQDDFLIFTNDAAADVPRSWDQTTVQNLAGSPPNFSFCKLHRGHLFAAGVHANPSTLYFSAPNDPETWSGGGSGSILVDPNDGDRITGLYSHRNELFVFKGPNKGSIHRITGSSSSDFARSLFVRGVGAVWQNSIFKFGDDVGFLWSDGSVRSLKATDAFGDYREASLSTPIQSWLDTHVNNTRLRFAWAATDASGGRTYITLAADGNTNNNVILCMDTRFSPVRWSISYSHDAACLALVGDVAAAGRTIIMLGGYGNGFVDRGEQPVRARPGSGTLAYRVLTPYLDYSAPHVIKTLAALSINIQPHNDGDIDIAWQRDGNTQQTDTIAGSGFDVLGTASANQFTLGTSQLAGSRYVSLWRELETGGEFRTIQYEFENDTLNEDVEIHGFSAMIDPGTVATVNV